MLATVTWVALLAALAALAMVWKLNGELAAARRRLDRYNRALFDAADDVRRIREQSLTEMAEMRAQLRRQAGEAVFRPEMPVREALALHPQVEQVMAGFHLGGCSHCAVDPDDTLAAVCAQHGADAAALLSNLNLLMDGATNGKATAPVLVKVPNVQLEL